METAIEIDKVGYEITGKTILRDVSFTVREGEYISIVGPNGAGKTTLLKMMSKILPVTIGDIYVYGSPLAAYCQKKLAKIISYVPQGAGAMFPFSVLEFVMMGRYPHLSSFIKISGEDRRAVYAAMEMTKITQFAENPINILSGGERQKVFIAAALAQGASMMLLDEPTTFLDPKRQSEINSILKNINKESNITIVSVTHDINHAISSSDRIIAMKDGCVVFNGAPTELMGNNNLERIFDISFHFAISPDRDHPVLFLE